MVDYYLMTLIVSALAAYAVFGGADFGAGVWEINHRFRSCPEDKQLIYRAIGPVWEANHVWLIFAITAIWTCYPNEFRQLCGVGSFLLTLALVGIVLRGASYAFRSSGRPGVGKRNWEALFAIASTATPFCFGCLVGVVTDDRPRTEERNVLTEWLTFPSIYFGFFAVGICVYLASIFLAREAAASGNATLEKRWRKNALLMTWLVGAFSIGGLGITAVYFTTVWQGITQSALPVVGTGIACGLFTILTVAKRKYWMASIAAAMAISLVLLAWVIGQVQSGHTFGIQRFQPNPNTENVRWLLLGCMLGGLLLITPPMIWLFYIFKTEPGKPKSTSEN